MKDRLIDLISCFQGCGSHSRVEITPHQHIEQLQSERVFGWKRTAVALGLAERRTGIRDLRKNKVPVKLAVLKK